MTAATDDLMICDFCHIGQTEDIVIRGEGDGTDVMACCWRCATKLPRDADLLDAVLGLMDGGASFNLAVMFATGAVPKVNTDDTFFQGWRGTGGEQFAGPTAHRFEQYVREAEAAGVSVQGRRYMHGLAEYPGDPRAWVGTKAEIRQRLREKGWGCERMGVAPDTATPPPEAPRLADDIVDRLAEKALADVPAAARTETVVRDARDAVIEKHGRPRRAAAGGVRVRRPGRPAA